MDEEKPAGAGLGRGYRRSGVSRRPLVLTRSWSWAILWSIQGASTPRSTPSASGGVILLGEVCHAG